MILGGVVDAPAKVAARRRVGYVEAGAGDADATEQVEAYLLSQFWLEQEVEVGQDGPIAFVAEVACLAGSPGSFHVESHASLKPDDIPADAKVSSALFRNIAEGQLAVAGRGRH